MLLTLLLPDVRLGAQRPRVHSGPRFTSSAGAEAVALASELGLFLDPWQAWVLEQSLGERPDGRWAAWQVCLLCPRQNGKGSILEARELAGLFLFGEKHITHSAHEAKTAKDHFERMEKLLRDAGYGDDKVTFRRSTTEVSILVKATGCKLIFYTRTDKGGRGLGGDMVVLDEAFALTRDQMAALMPTMSARSLTGNPQMWFTSSAGFDESEVLAQKKIQGEAGYDRLAYFDWSADDGASLTDRGAWAQANPGLGYRISEDFIADELPDLGAERFGPGAVGVVEDLSVGAEAGVVAGVGVDRERRSTRRGSGVLRDDLQGHEGCVARGCGGASGTAACGVRGSSCGDDLVDRTGPPPAGTVPGGEVRHLWGRVGEVVGADVCGVRGRVAVAEPDSGVGGVRPSGEVVQGLVVHPFA